jgi:hypothetical protein
MKMGQKEVSPFKKAFEATKLYAYSVNREVPFEIVLEELSRTSVLNGRKEGPGDDARPASSEPALLPHLRQRKPLKPKPTSRGTS